MSETTQGELDLEYPTYSHYTIKLAKGAVGDMEVVRTHTAHDVDGAINLVEGLRDLTANRDNVQWDGEEVDVRGLLYGLAPGGLVFEISIVPPLNTALAS